MSFDTAGEAVRTALRARWWRLRRAAVVRSSGVLVELDPSWAVPAIRDALIGGFYEQPELRILRRVIGPEDRVLEVGAGAGVTSSAMADIVGGAIVSFEANPAMADVARATVSLNGHDPAIVRTGVLGDHEGEVDFHVADEFWASGLGPVPGATAIKVQVQRFDETVSSLRPTVLVVDIEGGEIDLLATRRLPDHVRAVCVETHPAVTGQEAIDGLVLSMLEQGFGIDLGLSAEHVAVFTRG